MNNKSDLTKNYVSIVTDIIGWMFGILTLAIGLLNIFWGNDQGYGIFLVLLSLAFFPPSFAFLKKITGINIPAVLKILLAIFIIWSAMGVAELPNKIDMMSKELGF